MPVSIIKQVIRSVVLIVCAFLISVAFPVSVGADSLDNVRLTLISGSSIKSTIEKVDGQGNVFGQQVPANLQFDQIVTINTARKPAKPANGAVKVHLVDGGVVFCSEVSVTDERLKVESTSGTWEFPLDTVQAIAWNINQEISQLLSEPSKKDDVVVVKTKRGQQFVNGLLESIDGTHVHVNYEGKSRKISRAIVQAIVTADLKIKPPVGAKVSVFTADGSKLVGTLNSMDSGMFKMNLSGGNIFNVKVKNICRVTVQSDRIVYLSELEPIEVEQSSQFAAARKWKRNTSVAGNPMQLRFHSTGRVVSFDHGIGTKPYSMLSFENTKNYDQLRAIVGIDSDARGRGDCEMIVRGDGIQLWAQRVRGSDDPDAIVIDITGVNKVSLIVLPGENFDLGDHANWADARFTKSK